MDFQLSNESMVQKRWECSWVGEAWHSLTDFSFLSKKKTPTTPKIQLTRLQPEREPRPSSERFCPFVSETCSTQSQGQTSALISTPQTSAPQPLAVPRGKPRLSPLPRRSPPLLRPKGADLPAADPGPLPLPASPAWQRTSGAAAVLGSKGRDGMEGHRSPGPANPVRLPRQKSQLLLMRRQ